MLAHIDRDSPLYSSNTKYLCHLCIRLWQSACEHWLHASRSALFQHVVLLRRRVRLHYPQALCLLCSHVTSCSTVCVTHSLIPSHSQGHDAHWPKSLEIPPLFYPRGSVPKMFTHSHVRTLVPGAISISRHKTPLNAAFGGNVQYVRKQSAKKLHGQYSSHHRATVFFMIRLPGSVWPSCKKKPTKTK